MRNRLPGKIVLAFFCVVIVTVAGCINIGSCRAKYERTETLQASITTISNLVAKTCYGSIKIEGADVDECNIIARIRVNASTEEEAQAISEEVKIEIEEIGKTLNITVNKPPLKKNRSVCVNFDITIPQKMNVECKSSYGKIKVADIKGNVKANTSYGGISANRIEGTVDLSTSYGVINCNDIVSQKIEARSSYGGINISCADSSPAEMTANINTSYGGIDFAAPAGFSGQAELSTSYGSIKSELPITVKGKISSKKIIGTIGEGKGGKLRLKTSYGSIKLE